MGRKFLKTRVLGYIIYVNNIGLQAWNHMVVSPEVLNRVESIFIQFVSPSCEK